MYLLLQCSLISNQPVTTLSEPWKSNKQLYFKRHAVAPKSVFSYRHIKLL